MEKTSCLLVVPGIKAFPHKERLTTTYDFPNGILSLGSFIEANGCSVSLLPLDHYLTASDDGENIEKQIFSALEYAINKYDPKFIGVSVPYTMYYPSALKVVEFAKKINPELVTGIGGGHVSYLDKQCFDDSDYIDVVIRGEGEWTLLELMNAVESGDDFSKIKGITYRNDGAIIKSPTRPLGSIDDLPTLDFSLLPDDFVKNMAVSIVASRGCAYKCAYCNESLFWGNKVRKIRPEKIIAEMTQLTEKYGVYPVGLEDSMFHMKTSYYFDMMSKLSKIRLNPNFYILSRADCITKEGCETMLSAGIKNLVLGIESASPKVLSAMNKKITIEQAETACKMATDCGLIVGAFWIIGHPGDNLAEAELTINAIDRFCATGIIAASEIAMFVPYPGGDIFNDPEKYGVEILNYDWDKWGRFNTEPVCQLKDFQKNEIISAWIKAKTVEEKWRHQRANASLNASPAPAVIGKVGRNAPCPCGSGKKYKKCCGQ